MRSGIITSACKTYCENPRSSKLRGTWVPRRVSAWYLGTEIIIIFRVTKGADGEDELRLSCLISLA